MAETKNKGMSLKKARKLLSIAIILALISCFGASLLQTSFYKVEIINFTIPTDEGKWISGKLYKPAEAEADNQVPMVITCHGYLNNNEMQDSAAIELSRRGIAVIAMDAYFHGDSSSSDKPVIESCMTEATGMIPMVEYAYNSLNYVDKTRIGVMGHSMGGMDVWITLMHYGVQYYGAIEAAKSPDSDGGVNITDEEQAAADALNKVNAGLTSGFVGLSSEKTFSAIHANFAINYSKYDEGGYGLSNGNGDLSGNCFESLCAVNSGLSEAEKVSFVEIGKFYGNAEDKTLRVVYNPPLTHQLQHFSKTCTAENVEFFEKTFSMDNTISSGNQIWPIKELFNCLGLVACFLAIVPLAVLLLNTLAFSSLSTPVPEALPTITAPRRKAMFWIGWVISWVVSWLSFMPVNMLDTKIFPSTSSMGFANWFPQQCNNSIMLWAVFNGIVGLLLFWGIYRLWGKKEGVVPEMWGIKTNAMELVKTFVLSICVFVGFYAFAFLAEYFFDTDYRVWFVAVCTFSSDKLLIALEYLPLFFIFFAANAILTNSMNRVAGQKEWLNLLLCGLANVLGLVIVNAFQYLTLFSTGVAQYGESRLYPMVALPLIVYLFVATYINRALFKATGKVWLGAMVNCIIIVMISVANTATLLPL